MCDSTSVRNSCACITDSTPPRLMNYSILVGVLVLALLELDFLIQRSLVDSVVDIGWYRIIIIPCLKTFQWHPALLSQKRQNLQKRVVSFTANPQLISSLICYDLAPVFWLGFQTRMERVFPPAGDFFEAVLLSGRKLGFRRIFRSVGADTRCLSVFWRLGRWKFCSHVLARPSEARCFPPGRWFFQAVLLQQPQATEAVEKRCFSRISDETLGSFLAWFWN